MQFLKILFWCLLAFVAAVFTLGNWTTVTIKLWGGVEALINLPLLLFVTFLVGLVPTMLYYQAVRWRLRNRLATAERTNATLRELLNPAPAVVPIVDAVPVESAKATLPPPPPAAIPSVVPPGG